MYYFFSESNFYTIFAADLYHKQTTNMKSFCTVLMMCCLALGCMAQPFETDEFKTASGKTLKITCIKHATLMMEYDGKVIYFDPVINVKPYTDFTAFPKANYIFVTHEHQDHFDSMALTELRRNYTTIYVNHNVYENWGSGYVMANGDKAEVDVVCKADGKSYSTTATLVPVFDESLQYRVFVCIPKEDDGFKGYCGEFVFDGENLGY